MHPNFIELVDKLCRIYPRQINIITNGMLIPDYSRKSELLALFEKNPHVQFIVSEHVPIQDVLEFLMKHNMPHRVDRRWFRETGIGMMRSNKHFAFHSFNDGNDRCPTHKCRAIVGDRLHRCSRHASRANLVKYGLKNGKPVQDQEYIDVVNQWNGISLLDATPMEIRNYLTEYPFDECSLCLAQPQKQEQCQMTDEEYNAMFKAFETEPALEPNSISEV